MLFLSLFLAIVPTPPNCRFTCNARNSLCSPISLPRPQTAGLSVVCIGSRPLSSYLPPHLETESSKLQHYAKEPIPKISACLAAHHRKATFPPGLLAKGSDRFICNGRMLKQVSIQVLPHGRRCSGQRPRDVAKQPAFVVEPGGSRQEASCHHARHLHQEQSGY